MCKKKLRKSLIALFVIILLAASSVFIYYDMLPNHSQFSLNVTPDALKGDAIAGQLVVFLVSITDEGISGQYARSSNVSLSVSANSSAIFVEPRSIISPGQVAEVEVIPDVLSVGNNVTVAITAERDGFSQTRLINFTVAQGEDSRREYASQLRDVFVQWLQDNYPQFGITNQTQWQGTIVSPVWLVVSHYLFFSTNWEMHVYWHVMIPPYDWARIDLRQRFNETVPAYSFEISSLNASLPPHSITPPETIWR